MATVKSLTKAELVALVERMLASAPSAPSEASAHYVNRDIACTAGKPCVKTFRTAKGRDWHVANVKHA